MLPSGPPHFSFRIAARAASTLVYHPLPYMAHVNCSSSSANLTGTSHVSPSLDSASWQASVFWSNLMSGTGYMTKTDKSKRMQFLTKGVNDAPLPDDANPRW